jgi:hypothetical protein
MSRWDCWRGALVRTRRRIHGDPAEIRVRDRAGIGAQTKDRRVLVQERAGERGAVREVVMEHLFEFWVREARELTADRGRSSHSGVIERVAKRLARPFRSHRR